jgi:DnaJ-class molecular chaperone
LVVVGAAATDSLAEDYAADNFYQILGVPENASRRDIKRAYKAMMKDFHPDLSGDEESTEFCILLNDIYEVCRGQGGVTHIN